MRTLGRRQRVICDLFRPVVKFRENGSVVAAEAVARAAGAGTGLAGGGGGSEGGLLAEGGSFVGMACEEAYCTRTWCR